MDVERTKKEINEFCDRLLKNNPPDQYRALIVRFKSEVNLIESKNKIFEALEQCCKTRYEQ